MSRLRDKAQREMDKRRGDVAKMKFMLHLPLLSLYLHPLPLAFWHMAAHCACCAAILFAAISHFPLLFFFGGTKLKNEMQRGAAAVAGEIMRIGLFFWY